MGNRISGKDLEAHFDIPQQYRSRYDKQFNNFISPDETTPRTYSEFDVLAYELIVKMKGQSRIVIARKLAEMAKNGVIKFYPTNAVKSLEAILNYNPLQANDKKDKPVKREPRKQQPKKSGYELADEIGKLRAQNELLKEEFSAACQEIDGLSKRVALNDYIIEILTAKIILLEKRINRNDDNI